MDAFFNFSKPKPAQILGAVELELSGPALKAALEILIRNTENSGGIETYVEAINIKQDLFKEFFARDELIALTPEKMAQISKFLPTIRRRIGEYLEGNKFETLKFAIIELLDAKHDEKAIDARIEKFKSHFPQDREHRWVKDLAAELLHNTNPEFYPMMQRWVWDEKVNSGVIREIWHGDVDRVTIKVPDKYETYLSLRAELSQFLSQNGFYKNLPQYCDLLIAQIYAQYVAAQGGSYLRADFSSPEDGVAHLRRLLGLDGGKVKLEHNKGHDPISEG